MRLPDKLRLKSGDEVSSCGSTPTHQPLVLVVEDYADLRNQLIICLEHCQYRTLGFNSGDDVLVAPRETLMEASFALVDDRFPGNLTGPQTVAMLHRINPRLQIFPMSGRPFQGWELEVMDSHYRRCLAKPFGVEELLGCLQPKPTSPSMNQRSVMRSWISKGMPVLRPILRYGYVALLLGVAFHYAVPGEQFWKAIPWRLAFHWLTQAGWGASAVTVLLASITIGVFAFKSDLQTKDGVGSLLAWLVMEVIAVAVLLGLFVIVATVATMG